MTNEERIEKIIKIKKQSKSKFQVNQIEIEALELLLKVQQIKPRTIDNIEVGDKIEFDYINEDEEIQHVQGIVTEIYTGAFWIEKLEIEHEYITQEHFDIKITPHEWIELWDKING